MKDIAKPLEWEEKNSNLSFWEAAFPGIVLYRYKAHRFVNYKFICRLQIDVFGTSTNAWEGRDFSTIEEAKAACEKHYQEFVLSLLSPEAIQLLLKHDF